MAHVSRGNYNACGIDFGKCINNFHVPVMGGSRFYMIKQNSQRRGGGGRYVSEREQRPPPT